MANNKIESYDFRCAARDNCYKYGPFYVYSDKYISLDNHNFPNYSKKEGIGAVEKFLTLMQSLGKVAAGSDAIQKLSKPLPGVAWEGDDLSLSFSLDGTMYFLDYDDYKKCKSSITGTIYAQGWEQSGSVSKYDSLRVVTYKPKKNGVAALYNDDPVDSAGLAMMMSAANTAKLKMDMLSANLNDDSAGYAIAQARLDAKSAASKITSPTLSKIGMLGADLGTAIDAFGANLNSALVRKWKTAGNPIVLLIDGQPVAHSVNGVLTDLKLTEKAFVVDDTSSGYVYPTEMEVSLTIKNVYGSLLNTSSKG